LAILPLAGVVGLDPTTSKLTVSHSAN